jgi:hypothetical protein
MSDVVGALPRGVGIGLCALVAILMVTPPGSRLEAQELAFSLQNGSRLELVPEQGGDTDLDFEQRNRLQASFRWDLSDALRLDASGFAEAQNEQVVDTRIGEASLTGDLRRLELRGRWPVGVSTAGEAAADETGKAGTADSAGDSGAASGPSEPPSGMGLRYPRAAVWGFSVGRQPAEEFSGFVMDTQVDGAQISYRSATTELRSLVGYTGFRLRDSAVFVGSPAERGDSGNTFAPSRALALVSVSFPELLSRQSILLTGIADLDVPELPSSEVGGEPSTGRYHSLYGGAGLTGPLSTRMFYTLFGYYQRPSYGAGEDDGNSYSGHAAAGGGSLRYYLEELAYSTLQLRGAVASGDAGHAARTGDFSGDTSTLFTPVNDPAVSEFFEVQFSNIWFSELQYSLRPFAPDYPTRSGFTAQVGVQAIGRPTSGAGTVASASADLDSGYLGTAGFAELRYRAGPNLSVSGVVDVFWPADLLVQSGSYASERPLTRIGIDASLAF